jgi:hypothetical protein
MTYPPQPGGWPDQQGNWQSQPAGGWQDPAGQPVYVDPASGQPAYLDPAGGQPAYADPISGQPAGWPAQQPYSPAPGYGDYQAYPPYQAPIMVPARRTNGISVAAMIVAIIGLISSPCYGIPGIAIGLVGAILGHVGHRQTKERGEDGGGMAVAGIAIGWISVLAGLIAFGIYLYIWFWFKNTIDNYSHYPTPNYT